MDHASGLDGRDVACLQLDRLAVADLGIEEGAAMGFVQSLSISFMKYYVCHVAWCLPVLKYMYASLIQTRLFSADRGTRCTLPSGSITSYSSVLPHFA